MKIGELLSFGFSYPLDYLILLVPILLFLIVLRKRDRAIKTYKFAMAGFVLCSTFMLCVLYWTFVVYVSIFNWAPYPESDGIQYLGIVYFSTSLLTICGLFNLFLSRWCRIAKITIAIPFVITTAIYLPLFHEWHGTLFEFACYIGACITIFSFAVISILTVVEVRNYYISGC